LRVIAVALAPTKTTTRNANETPIGRAIVSALISPPRAAIILTITRPTTSSSMAAVTSTAPTLVEVNWAVERIANVVPSEVEESAAPAAKALSLLTSVDVNKGIRSNERAIGARIPVNATRIDGPKVCFRRCKSVVRPPVAISFNSWSLG